MDRSFLDSVKDFGLEWSGVFTILFMFLICFFLWRTLKLMPRTKPVQIKPETKTSIGWDDRPPRVGHLWRARPDAQPAARRAGRLRFER